MNIILVDSLIKSGGAIAPAILALVRVRRVSGMVNNNAIDLGFQPGHETEG